MRPVALALLLVGSLPAAAAPFEGTWAPTFPACADPDAAVKLYAHRIERAGGSCGIGRLRTEGNAYDAVAWCRRGLAETPERLRFEVLNGDLRITYPDRGDRERLVRC
ncbi:hypothetical protein [Prosthecomicrobium sp. N25]|uniref:hypothetical protein n=1 Tax=Prosthecomicrobium sp. N25 TaxID=3129254 RepID=UPI0030781B1F